MRRLVLLFALLCLSYLSFSQKIRFTDATNVWRVSKTYWTQAPNSSTTYYEYRYSGDTNYGGFDYHLLPDVVYGVTYLVREDTLVNKVYYRLFSGADTNEYIAYDYNLMLGDTFLVRGFQGTNTCTVVDLDSVLIQNVYHKYWELSGQPAIQFRVVEGIGDLYTPTRHFNPNVGTAIPHLYCFSQGITTPPILNNIGILDNSCVLDINDLKNKHKILAFPNPVVSGSELRFEKVHKGKMVIWNQLGQEVYQQILNGSEVTPIGRIIHFPGMYYYKLLDYSEGGEKQYKGSFIRE